MGGAGGRPLGQGRSGRALRDRAERRRQRHLYRSGRPARRRQGRDRPPRRQDAAAEGSIDVSTSPLYGLAINQTTQTLYGTDTRNGSVSAVDLATGKVVGTVKVGEKAHVRQVAVDEGANKVYVTVVGAMRGSDTPSAIWVIDGKSNTLDRVIAVPGISLTGLALDPANKRIFSTGMSSNDVIVLDSDSGAVKARWPSGGENAINVAYDGTAQRLFVANQGNGVLGVINARDGSLIKAVPTGKARSASPTTAPWTRSMSRTAAPERSASSMRKPMRSSPIWKRVPSADDRDQSRRQQRLCDEQGARPAARRRTGDAAGRRSEGRHGHADPPLTGRGKNRKPPDPKRNGRLPYNISSITMRSDPRSQ